MAMLLAIPPILLEVAAAAWFLVPSGRARIYALLHLGPAEVAPAAPTTTFINLPEMTVTLPNGGQPRQMRIKLSLEVVSNGSPGPTSETLSPRVYDALLTYLRTLHDNELGSGLALDRIRQDLFRRVDLVLGPGQLRAVLITGLVLG